MRFVVLNCSFGQKYLDVRTYTVLLDFSVQCIIRKFVRSTQLVFNQNSNYILIVYNHLTNHPKLSGLKQVFILVRKKKNVCRPLISDTCSMGGSMTRAGESLWWLIPWSQLCWWSVENSARAPSQRSSFLSCGSLMGLLGLLHIRWLNLRCECRKQWKLPVSYSISMESGTVLLLLNSTGHWMCLWKFIILIHSAMVFEGGA